ncbi:MAG: NAD(P)H-dependent oxidoreductase [Candidatus Saccharibacteria bacterium]|nr:NAD(P)H-dependent oxidoreductase [Candidatus Saccharibacteria bacterium]
MKTILIITGSVRKKRAADGVLAQVVGAVEASGAKAQVADLRELNLPMLDETHRRQYADG